MNYTPMVGSPIINVLFYTHNGGSPVKFSIRLQTTVGVSPKNLAKVFTLGGSSPRDLHTQIVVHL